MPYESLPGPRLAYDVDGTVVVMSTVSTGFLTATQDGLRGLNSEGNCGGALVNYSYFQTSSTIAWADIYTYFSFVFPVRTRIDGIAPEWFGSFYGENYSMAGWRVYTSTDTTNGVDGIWTYYGQLCDSYRLSTGGGLLNGLHLFTGASIARGIPNGDTWRRYTDDGGYIYSVAGAAVRNVKGLRLVPRMPKATSDNTTTYSSGRIHLFGAPDSLATTERLAFWQVGSDLEVSSDWFVFGDTPVSSSEDKTFRIKNLSETLTANSIVVEALPMAVYEVSPTPAPEGFFLFSTDGSTWTTTVTVAALSPEAISGTIYVRRITPSTATLGIWEPRITADVGSWS